MGRQTDATLFQVIFGTWVLQAIKGSAMSMVKCAIKKKMSDVTAMLSVVCACLVWLSGRQLKRKGVVLGVGPCCDAVTVSDSYSRVPVTDRVCVWLVPAQVT